MEAAKQTLENMRVEREKAIQNVNSELDKKIMELRNERETNIQLSDWYASPLPDALIVRGKTGNKDSHTDR
jgi:NADPH-dependent curcumin reductase CurA